MMLHDRKLLLERNKLKGDHVIRKSRPKEECKISGNENFIGWIKHEEIKVVGKQEFVATHVNWFMSNDNDDH